MQNEDYLFGFWEKGPGFSEGFSDFPRALNGKSISAGLVAAIFGCTGPALVTISSAQAAGFTMEQTVSWLFGIYVFGGLISIVMASYYKMPIVGAYSIPGAAMMATGLLGFTFNEAVFAFLVAALIVGILGVTGLVGKIMQILPMPIVMGMIVGVMLRFGIGIVNSVVSAPVIAGSTVLAFFIMPKLVKAKVPPVVWGLAAGVIAVVVTGGFTGDGQAVQYIPPQLVMPHVNVATILSVSVPLAMLVIGAENAQAYGVLKSQGYKTPINAMSFISGAICVGANIFGGHNANIAGPMTAICSSTEGGDDVKDRYSAAIVCGIAFAVFGIFASFAIAFIGLVPGALVSTLAGLAMINVLINSLTAAFKTGRCKMGAFVSFIIGASGITVFSIGAAFWALLIGLAVTVFFESEDFKAYREGEA